MSPLFTTVHGTLAYAIRVGMGTNVAGKEQLMVAMKPVKYEECEPVLDINEAEDRILALVEPIEHEVEVGEHNEHTVYAGILIQAMRYCNMIAARTRRGSGNVILMGRDVFAKVEAAYKEIGSDGYLAGEPELVGRWEKKGVAVGGMTVYVGDAIPADEVFVAYVGPGTAIDGPGGLLKNDEDKLHLFLMDNTTSTVCNATDYVQRFRVTSK